MNYFFVPNYTEKSVTRLNANVNKMEKLNNMMSHQSNFTILTFVYLNDNINPLSTSGTVKNHVWEKSTHLNAILFVVIKIHVTRNYFLSQWQRWMAWKPVCKRLLSLPERKYFLKYMYNMRDIAIFYITLFKLLNVYFLFYFSYLWIMLYTV